MRTILSIFLIFPALAFGQQSDPTQEEFAAAVSLMVRYLNVIRETQQTETAEILDIQRLLQQRNDNFEGRLNALEAAQKAAPVLRQQQITIMSPATP